MELKGARPGRFSPGCQKCGQKFLLTIYDDPNKPPVAAAIVARATGEKLPSVIEAALGIEPTPAPAVKVKHRQAATQTAAPVARIAPALVSQTAVVEHAASVGETAAPEAVPVAAAIQTAAQTSAPTETQPQKAARDHAGEEPAPDLAIAIGGRLGGYEIIQKLGQGGMGAVYLARQVSLDRNVAVKVLAPQFARDDSFIARFTREAYAAAQLTHHNVVQIHDIGEERDVHYFSMEFVEGQTLGSLVKHEGKLDPEAAAGYILQAARGLKFAHDHGMIHRDIKPDNLLLGEQGMLKVADLGLVKRQGLSDITSAQQSALAKAQSAATTGAHLSMGTPAYMAPEQANDAATVDARADIYSLGCTFYDLLTGRPPFVGQTAVEVMTKHASEAVVPPDVIVKRVPKTLSVILLKMVAKKPADRYRDMNEVIKALEDYLGQGSAGPFTPKEEHAKALELAVDQFNKTPMASLRAMLIPGYLSLCAVLTVAMFFLATRGDPAFYIKLAGGIVGLGVLTLVSYIVLTGIVRKTHLFTKLRQFAFGARFVDWGKLLLFAAVLVGVLVLFDLQWVWLGFFVAGALVAAAFYFSVDLLLAGKRKTPVTQIEGMLKQMRMRGLDEESLRQFVCRYSGNRWEEFYEALFGYEAKMQARQRWGVGERGKDRKKWAAWRDPIIGWINARMRQRQEQKEAHYLARLEERKLRAQGVDILQARATAKKSATKLVEKAARMKESIEEMRHAATAGPSRLGAASITYINPASLFDEDSHGDHHEERKHESYIQRKYGSIWGLLLGSQVRFFLGLGLLACFLLWMYQTNPNFMRDLGHKSVQTFGDTHDQLSGESNYQYDPKPDVKVDLKNPEKPIDTGNSVVNRWIPSEQRTGILAILGSYPAGLAGAFLLISSLFRGAKMGLFMVVATGVTLLAGHAFNIPTMNLVKPEHAGMVAGGGVAMLGLMFGRE